MIWLIYAAIILVAIVIVSLFVRAVGVGRIGEQVPRLHRASGREGPSPGFEGLMLDMLKRGPETYLYGDTVQDLGCLNPDAGWATSRWYAGIHTHPSGQRFLGLACTRPLWESSVHYYIVSCTDAAEVADALDRVLSHQPIGAGTETERPNLGWFGRLGDPGGTYLGALPHSELADPVHVYTAEDGITLLWAWVDGHRSSMRSSHMPASAVRTLRARLDQAESGVDLGPMERGYSDLRTTSFKLSALQAAGAVSFGVIVILVVWNLLE